ncbi:MAG: helix-turn-helix domain-containing protein, partial [Pseudonocardia sp.]
MPYVPTIKRRRLGAALRRQREQAGYSTESAAAAVGWSQSKVSRVETAAIAVNPADVRTLLGRYGAPSGVVDDLLALAAEAQQPPAWLRQFKELRTDQFAGYLALEAEASRYSSYQSEVLPGLLQIEPYARDVLAQDPLKVVPYEIDQAVRVRLARQARLSSQDPLQLDVVLDEGTLRRQAGSVNVMHAQLHHLVEMAQRPHIIVRVLPFDAGVHPASNGSFALLEFSDPDDPIIVCTDSLMSTTCREEPREVSAYQLVLDRLRA